MQVTLRNNWIYVRRRVINTLTKNTPTQKGDHHEEQFRTGVIRAAYNTAKETGNEDGIEKAKADMRSLNEAIGAKGDAYAFVYRLYQEMKEAGNEHIDLHDTIRDEAKMIETLRSLGVESFTFSSGWSSAVESAWIFQENGGERLQAPGSHRTQQPSHELVYRNKGKGSRLPFQHPVKGGRG